MIEAESAPASSKKRTIMFWPSVVMMALVFGFWVFLYDDVFWTLFYLVIHLFALICLISFVCLIVFGRLRKSLSFFVPILLGATMGWWFIPVPLPPLYSMLKAFSHSRGYVEFLIYDARHHIKSEVRNSRPELKEWHLHKNSTSDFQIVYDVTDKTLKEDGIEEGGCYSEVYSLGGHFYFVRGICIGFQGI